MENEELLREILNLLKEYNRKFDLMINELEDLKNLFMKYDLELEDYEEEIRED
jgi:type II secretory pathway predicted ATPase ExeA